MPTKSFIPLPLHLLLPLLLLLLPLPSSCQPCTPFGLRTSFGESYRTATSPQLLQLRFNTESPCPNSFLKVTQGPYSTTFPCTPTHITVTNQTTFTTYVQTCSLRELKAGEDLRYTVYGVDEAGVVVVGATREVRMVDPKADGSNRFIVLADWSKLVNKKYTTLQDSFDVLLRDRTSIHGIILIGDIGYDLETNECQNYLGFLEILEQVASVWPVIIVTGNHEYVSKKNWDLYVKSFQLYDLVSQNKINLHIFKNFALVTWDPYRQIYNTSTASQTQQYLHLFTQSLISASSLNLPWLLSSSHYPLLCSAPTKNCSGVNSTLSPFFWALNDHHFNLYLGAHTHIYERIYPYYKGQVQEIPGPYHNIDGMVSVVEGVAGNQKDSGGAVQAEGLYCGCYVELDGIWGAGGQELDVYELWALFDERGHASGG